jgi:GNAT superfamily N-acetyltransferase
METVMITDYQPQYAADFKQLNLAWIERYFRVEEHDLEQLSHPDTYIIEKGGHILLALYNGKAVGTCALIKTGDKEFELAKMAVAEDLQGHQIGKKLGLAALEKARRLQAERVWLESNHILTPAINLYRKLGFVEIPVTDTPYARADIKMELFLSHGSTEQ